MVPDLPPPLVVTTTDQLRQVVERLRRVDRVAVDTESNSLYAYRERVCLIQLSTADSDILVDPLAVEDVSGLSPVLADPAVEKVFHAAEYDLICLRRDFDFHVSPLFDTRVAARTLGQPRTGLGDLLQDAYGVSIDKRHQRANWGKRPLPPALLDYARLDTHYLLPLRDRLAGELAAAGRTAEALEECDRMTTTVDISTPENDQPPFWRITHARRLTGSQAAVLRELYAMREDEARRRDCPPFKVLSDASLLAIAQASPRSRRALERVEGLPTSAQTRYGETLLSAVRRGLETPPPPRPMARGPDEAAQTRFQRLREWRRQAAAAHGVESDVILPKEMAWEIARANPADLQALHPLMAPLETRFASHGAAILVALHNGLSTAGQRR